MMTAGETFPANGSKPGCVKSDAGGDTGGGYRRGYRRAILKVIPEGRPEGRQEGEILPRPPLTWLRQPDSGGETHVPDPVAP